MSGHLILSERGARVFLERFGFTADPFQSTNAAEEPKISEYFVPPPYFAAVVGDPSQPKSQVILAPRGGGKTAQRVMLERTSLESKDFLCIVYDEFIFPEKMKLSDVNLNYHIRNVNELLTVAILLACASEGKDKRDFDPALTRVLKQAIEIYLGDHSQQVHSSSIGKFRNLGDKASRIWEDYGGKISLLVNGVLAYFGQNPVDLSGLARNPENYDQSHQFYLEQLSAIAVELGYRSVYVLVDRVDETIMTGADAKLSYQFIKPLIADLHVLETKNVAFKFFLWDQIKAYYVEDAARPDRVKLYSLAWSIDEISRMLSERLRAFSDGKIDSLNSLTERGLNTHLLVSYVAEGSPRDLIRVCGRIIDEQTRIEPRGDCVSHEKVWEGVKQFCFERSEELYPRHISDLRKVAAPTFTNRMLANDVFRVSENAIRPKIQSWQDAGAVERIGEVANPGNRPLYLYGLSDTRLCVSAMPNTRVDELFGNFFLACKSCNRINITDQDEFRCPCGTLNKLEDAKSVYELCLER